MRCERRPNNEGVETIAYMFHFQIANNGGRQACSVAVQAPTIHDATTFFRQNWPMIESMARWPSHQIRRRPDNQAGRAWISGAGLIDRVIRSMNLSAEKQQTPTFRHL
jgi:hypothetical protein